MTTRAAAVLLAFALGAHASAQTARDQQEEFDRTQQQLQRNRSEVDRLIDMRLRHDLGLPAEADPSMPRTGPISMAQKDRMLRELRDQDGQNATLLARFNKLKSMVESLREDAAVRAKEDSRDQFVVVPSAGTMQAGAGSDRPVEAVDTVRRSPRDPGGPASGEPGPVGEGIASLPSAAADAVRLGRVRGQIRGSDDHLRVAQALFHAGQALTDAAGVAREEGDAAAAAELDDRGKARLERAIAELRPLLEVAEPSYQALFCKGRCLELLFRHSVRYEDLSLERSTKLFQQREQEVREPFLAISARDVERSGSRGEVEVLGSWGMAANAAVEHFRWMNLHGSYRPIAPIDSIRWPGEREQ